MERDGSRGTALRFVALVASRLLRLSIASLQLRIEHGSPVERTSVFGAEGGFIYTEESPTELRFARVAVHPL
jgi:hypothetical protein